MVVFVMNFKLVGNLWSKLFKNDIDYETEKWPFDFQSQWRAISIVRVFIKSNQIKLPQKAQRGEESD